MFYLIAMALFRFSTLVDRPTFFFFHVLFCCSLLSYFVRVAANKFRLRLRAHDQHSTTIERAITEFGIWRPQQGRVGRLGRRTSSPYADPPPFIPLFVLLFSVRSLFHSYCSMCWAAQRGVCTAHAHLTATHRPVKHARRKEHRCARA